MPISMCRPRVSLLSAIVVGCIATSGCATVSSMDVPWKTQTDGSSAADDADSSTTNTQSSDDDAVREATYWAKKAISASNQIAYARHLRSVTEHHPELFATKTNQEDTASSSDSSETSDADGAGRREDAAPAPDTRSVARTPDTETDETSDQTTSSASDAPSSQASGDTPDDDAPSATSTEASATVRTIERNDSAESRAKPDVWPVALQKSYGASGTDHTPDDPSLDTTVHDLTDPEARKTISETFGLQDLPDQQGAVAIPGVFLKPAKFEEFKDNEFKGFNGISEEQRRNQVAIVVPGERIAVYAGNEEIASLAFEGTADLPSSLTAVRPIRVVDDGTIQLLAYWPETSESDEEDSADNKDKDDAPVEYKAGILKVIGPYVGTLFEETVATRPADADPSELKRTGYVDFLEGEDHNHLRWIPADEQGRPAINRADVLEWNRWEGLFRVPSQPPTAPDQTS